jgi:pimeloyl-ACP methyl ester carboxylesterase
MVAMNELSLSTTAQRPAAPEPDRHGQVRAASTAGFHTIAYTDWGSPDAASTVICVHGLTRQGRDFDFLADRLRAAGHRVICPDLAGRGRSSWLPNAFDYVFPQYCADLVTLIGSIESKEIGWVGSSLGGLIGIVLAGMPGSPITRLVVNDIGPDVPIMAASRVGWLLKGMPASFASLAEAENYYRTAFSGYGSLSDEQWQHVTRHSVRFDLEHEHYVGLVDPKVISAYRWLMYYQMTLWTYWSSIKGPILTIRGRDTDFLPPYLLRDMQRRAPQLQVHDVDGVGHMPMLMEKSQIDAVSAFLEHGQGARR